MQTAPFGSWVSPITSELITKSSIRLGGIVIDGDAVYWSEQRPLEGGRNVIVGLDKKGVPFDVTPAPFNVRTQVHEYGGGAFTVHNGTVYFCNYADQQIYRHKIGDSPKPLTAEAKARFADMVIDEKRERLICVHEDHSAEGQEALNTLVSVSLKDGTVEMLIAGNDFYASPSLSPNGMFMSWISWNHPNMPWDESTLWAGNVASDGSLSNMRKIAGGKDESVFEPIWSPGGELFYVSDRSGWWNIYRHTDYEGEQDVVRMDAEFGLPQWVFGMSTYGVGADEKILSAYTQNGVWKLALIGTMDGTMRNYELPFTDYSSVRCNATKGYFIAGSPTLSRALIELDLASGKHKVLRASSDLKMDEGYLSQPEAIEFPTTGGKTAHAIFYAPKNKDFAAPAGDLPPLVVHSHGGPTAQTSSTLNLEVQYWTSRGFAVVDVNYGGSTGYGREYRNRLYDSWGVVDVDDCTNAAIWLAEQKRVDKNRLAISGGSAGGYTTLCALTFKDVFKAGASHYGVSDLEALATDTHKFEARYLDRLVGPYPAAKDIYKARSPINHVEKLKCPAIFLQGLEDKVVPPNQSEMMVDALRKRGVPVAYVTFEGEQHGFRQAKNIQRAMDAELYFYSRIFEFSLPEKIEPVQIDNLEAAKV